MKNYATYKKKPTWDTQRGQKYRELKSSIAGRRWGYAGRVAKAQTEKGGGAKSGHGRGEKVKAKVPSAARDESRSTAGPSKPTANHSAAKESGGEPPKKKKKRRHRAAEE